MMKQQPKAETNPLARREGLVIRELGDEVLVYDRALTDLEIQTRYDTTKTSYPQPAWPVEPYRVATGPFIEWKSPTSIQVSWNTESAMPSVLEFGDRPGL